MNRKPSHKRIPPVLANLALVLLFTGLSLWLADLAFRAYERAELIPRLPAAGEEGPVNLGALRYNEGWVERESPAGSFRILSLGDSFAFSVMEPPLSYGGVLENQLQQANVAEQVQVVNLGEPATGTRQYRLAYDYWSKVLEHDGVLFMIFIGNDLLDDSYLHAGIEWAPNEAVIEGGNPILEPGARRVPHKFPLRMLDYAYAWYQSGKTRSKQALPEGYNWAGLTDFDHETFMRINARYMENFDPGQLPGLLPGYEQVKLLLQRAAEIAGSGLKVTIAVGPSEAQVDDALRAQVLEFEGREQSEFDMGLPMRIISRLRDVHAPGVDLLDLAPWFRARAQDTGEGLFFRHNTHWNRAGNRVAGEVLAAHMRESWFKEQGALQAPAEFEQLPSNVLLDEAQIDAYLSPLQGYRDSGGTIITGAVRAIHLVDGVRDRDDNWAIAPLGTPILVRFGHPVAVSALRLYLYDADGRRYRFRLELEAGGTWQTLVSGEGNAVTGPQEIQWNGGEVSAVRITGLYSSLAERDPKNAYIHIRELEIVH